MNIEQSARDAARELMEAICETDGTPASFAVFLTGEEDEHFAVQAFQRAIDAAKAQQREADARVAADYSAEARRQEGMLLEASAAAAAAHIAAAIREGKRT